MCILDTVLYPKFNTKNECDINDLALQKDVACNLCMNKLAKARKMRKPLGTLSLKKFWLGNLRVEKVWTQNTCILAIHFRKIHFQKIHFRKIDFRKIHF